MIDMVYNGFSEAIIRKSYYSCSNSLNYYQLKVKGENDMKKAGKVAKKVTDNADGESAVLSKIATMPEPDRAMSERLHTIIKASAPVLSSRLWYGMPAYSKDGKVVCFFRDTQKFKERYMTLGFNQEANLDEGDMWPIAFAVKKLTATEEEKISALVKKAVR